jgi:hypothetical protein
MAVATFFKQTGDIKLRQGKRVERILGEAGLARCKPNTVFSVEQRQKGYFVAAFNTYDYAAGTLSAAAWAFNIKLVLGRACKLLKLDEMNAWWRNGQIISAMVAFQLTDEPQINLNALRTPIAPIRLRKAPLMLPAPLPVAGLLTAPRPRKEIISQKIQADIRPYVRSEAVA